MDHWKGENINMDKKVISLMLVLVLLCGSVPVLAEERQGETVLPLYVNDISVKEEISLYFPDGQTDIPFICAEEMCRVMNRFYGEDSDFEVTVQGVSPYTVLVRESQTDAYIDFENSLLGFSQYNRFFAGSRGANMLDLVVTGDTKGNGETKLIKHESSFECAGNYTDIDLKEYDIPVLTVNGVGYLPLQTFSDLFMAPCGCALCYNGEIVVIATTTTFFDSMLQPTELGELYYSVPTRLRSDALATFTVNELCLALDFHYGLKEEHGIENFRDYFIRSGLLIDLLDPDAKVSSNAILNLCSFHFSDGHSGMLAVSPYTDSNDDDPANFANMPMGAIKKTIDIFNYYGKRNEFYPNGMPGYEEVGNTAYITFDTFLMDTEKDYYSETIPEDFSSEEADTVELMIYANRQITRENSPVENVVIDLSCNTGGMLDVAACVCSWLLVIGTVHIEDRNSGSKAATNYFFDANLNHLFGDKGDAINDKNLFCLISPVSFSCGNLVPAALRSSGMVTLLGMPSSGGACAVQVLSAADGTLFAVSGRYRINTVNNGIFYSVDAGVEPHFYLPKVSMFYDRNKLTDYINSLMW